MRKSVGRYIVELERRLDVILSQHTLWPDQTPTLGDGGITYQSCSCDQPYPCATRLAALGMIDNKRAARGVSTKCDPEPSQSVSRSGYALRWPDGDQ